MRPRLRLVRTLHLKLRFVIQSLFGREASLPRYWRAQMTKQDEQRIRDACKEFIGGHAADPKIAHQYKINRGKHYWTAPPSPRN